jgi:hypothetical protein
LVKIFDIDRLEVPVDVDDDCDGNSRLRRSHCNYYQTEKVALKLVGIQKPVENYKIDIDRVEDEFNGHQHRNQISSGQKTIDADKEHQGTDNKK